MDSGARYPPDQRAACGLSGALIVSKSPGKLFELVIVVGGKGVAVGSMFLCSLLAARGLGPNAYGHFAAALSLVLLLDGLVGTPLDLATVRFGALFVADQARSLPIQIALLRGKCALGALIVVIAVTYPTRLTLSFLPGATPTLWFFISINIAALLVLRAYSATLQSQSDFRSYSLLDVVQGGLRLCLFSGLALAAEASAATYLGLYAVATLVSMALGRRRLRLPMATRAWPPAADLRLALRYVGTTGVISILGTISARTDVVIIAAQGHTAATAYYSVAAQIAMIGTLLASYASIVVQPRLLELTRQGQLLSLVKHNLRVSAVCALVLAVLQNTVLPDLVVRLFGAQYLPALPILTWLLWSAWLDTLLFPVLVPYGLQLQARSCLLAECLFTSCYLAALPLAIAHVNVGIGVAMLVTALRVAKLTFYGVLLWNTQAGHARTAVV